MTPGLLERGAEIEDRLERPLEFNHSFHHSPRVVLARFMIRFGELDQARVILEEAEAVASERGDEHSRMLLHCTLGLLEWHAGRWASALDHVSTGYELAEQTDSGHARAYSARGKALVEADLGLIEQARASAEEGLAFSRAMANESFTILNLGVLGHLRLRPRQPGSSG